MSVRENDCQFVDTNIFLYAYDVSDPAKQKEAKALIRRLWDSRLGRVSIQVLQELYVNLTRKVNPPLEGLKAKQIISDLGHWKHHVPDVASLQKAADLEHCYKLSFWDAMIICSAQEMQCSIIWTEDLNDGQKFNGTVVKNPFN